MTVKQALKFFLPLAFDGLRYLVRVVRKPKPPVNPLSHKDVTHIQAQIKKATKP